MAERYIGTPLSVTKHIPRGSRGYGSLQTQARVIGNIAQPTEPVREPDPTHPEYDPIKKDSDTEVIMVQQRSQVAECPRGKDGEVSRETRVFFLDNIVNGLGNSD